MFKHLALDSRWLKRDDSSLPSAARRVLVLDSTANAEAMTLRASSALNKLLSRSSCHRRLAQLLRSFFLSDFQYFCTDLTLILTDLLLLPSWRPVPGVCWVSWASIISNYSNTSRFLPKNYSAKTFCILGGAIYIAPPSIYICIYLPVYMYIPSCTSHADAEMPHRTVAHFPL